MDTYYYGKPLERYDAIVIGTGITGGWAAKELCENGLKTLVLERGRMVHHIKDYPTANMDSWDFKHRGKITKENLVNQQTQKRTGGAFNDSSRHWFVDDLKNPYKEKKRFDWLRGYHVGGKSLMWARMSFRWSDIDFGANKKDGHGVDWPIRYNDLKPWYDKVEEYIGVTGKNEGLPQLPDGIFEPPFEFNCVEQELQKGVAENFSDRRVIHDRRAHINSNKTFDGRSKCMHRNRCIRGCPFGAYFSSNSSTLPAAERTGNMVLRPNSTVHEIIYDEKTGKATGVKVIDTETKENFVFEADIIFCCAGTIPTTSILMQSKSERFPNGLGNDSGELGHNLMDHHFRVGASAIWEGHEDKYFKGRKPSGFYIPRFQNIDKKSEKKEFVRGYGMQGGSSRSNWQRAIGELSYGKDLKEELTKPGEWSIGMTCFGEMLPNHDNKMTLDFDNLDEWGLPIVTFDCEYGENEMKMREDMLKESIATVKAAGFKNIKARNEPCFPGNGIHEMGTARMGHDPKTSIVNKHNEIHTVSNVYVTDGACMASSACQNPSLTYMAITSRAANYAAKKLLDSRKA